VADCVLFAAGRLSDICGMKSAIARQLDRIRAMTADEKVRLAHALWVEAREVTAAGVRARHPEWSDAQVAERVREIMSDADT
jgi:hypothetical protein